MLCGRRRPPRATSAGESAIFGFEITKEIADPPKAVTHRPPPARSRANGTSWIFGIVAVSGDEQGRINLLLKWGKDEKDLVPAVGKAAQGALKIAQVERMPEDESYFHAG